MGFTIEPGLYFQPGTGDASGLSGIGVRIEDDVVVTPEGCDVLSAALPTELEEVEALMGATR
jgi:Xaa-Pro aminopeptidase